MRQTAKPTTIIVIRRLFFSHLCCLRSALFVLVTMQLYFVFVAAVQADDGHPKAARIKINQKVMTVPGDPERPVTLEVTLYTPDGPGPFPLAIFNHGASHGKYTALSSEHANLNLPTLYFLSRGYAVVQPMMRGFGNSGGVLVGHGCNLTLDGENNAKDIKAVIDYFKGQSYIDSSDVVVAGQSYGGFNSLHFGALGGSDAKAIISFSGGVLRFSDICTKYNDYLISDFGYMGDHSKTPALLFYGENDSHFPKETIRQMVGSYLTNGKARFVNYGKFKNDSHQLASYRVGLGIWVPKVDEFLQGVGLPATAKYPVYLPTLTPRPSGYAKLETVSAVPYLKDAGRKAYKGYLEKPGPKAFFVTPSGGWIGVYKQFDPYGLALKVCAQKNLICLPYAVDDDVVWVKPR